MWWYDKTPSIWKHSSSGSSEQLDEHVAWSTKTKFDKRRRDFLQQNSDSVTFWSQLFEVAY